MTPCPNQEEPMKLTSIILDRDWLLDADLGLWVTYKPIILRDAYIETTTDILYVQSEHGYLVQHVCSAGHMSTYEPTETYNTEPLTAAIFTPINKLNGKITCTHLMDSFLLDVQHRSVDLLSFRSYIENLDPQLQRLLGNLKDQD
eukprot:5576317-Ditylum_brightwellii.AAC.1